MPFTWASLVTIMLLFLVQERFTFGLIHKGVLQKGSTHSRRGALHLVRAMNGGNDADGKSEINARRSSSIKCKISVSKLLLNTDKHRQLKKIGEAAGQGSPARALLWKKRQVKRDRPLLYPRAIQAEAVTRTKLSLGPELRHEDYRCF